MSSSALTWPRSCRVHLLKRPQAGCHCALFPCFHSCSQPGKQCVTQTNYAAPASRCVQASHKSFSTPAYNLTHIEIAVRLLIEADTVSLAASTQYLLILYETTMQGMQGPAGMPCHAMQDCPCVLRTWHVILLLGVCCQVLRSG